MKKGRERRETLSQKILSCPKCRCEEIDVNEVIEASSEHRVSSGVWIHKYDNNEYGNCIRIECICTRCGHNWTSHRGLDFGNYYLEEDAR